MNYAGLHMSRSECLDLPVPLRRWFVDRLFAQLEYEKMMNK